MPSFRGPAECRKLEDFGNTEEDEMPKPLPGKTDEALTESQLLLIQDIKVIASHLPRDVTDPLDLEQPIPADDHEHPQIKIQKFWQNFEPDYKGGITQILPATLTSSPPPYGTTTRVTVGFSQARETCIKNVRKIVQECRALNQKYTDIHFDLERDLKLTGDQDCLCSLVGDGESPIIPRDVKRVTDICVIQDPEVGVYGFVFYRDGEWQPCIIDDKLYLRAPTFHESTDTVLNMYGVKQRDQEKSYKEIFQTGSKALHFAACRDRNETWVPLLEKAFAKAHGDYESLEGGWTGEALEDLTGGVTTEIYANNILSKDHFWEERLCRVGKEYLFSASSPDYTDWRGVSDAEGEFNRVERQKGIEKNHAYAILGTYTGFGQRLVKMRNPWGHQEWSGAWSDGSKEWTATWLQRLAHKFGDDGVFWISYEDMLNRYASLNCTRIFGPEWYVAQQWTKVQVPWSIIDYQRTKFTFDLPAASEVVIVLSKLDERYFVGFQGQYSYELHFRLHKDGDDEDDYVARSKFNYELERSVNVELELGAGSYTVLFKLEASENGMDDIETVLKDNKLRRAKITQIATLYDLAHAKGMPVKEDEGQMTPFETDDGWDLDDQDAQSHLETTEYNAEDEASASDQEGTTGHVDNQANDTKEIEQKKGDEMRKEVAQPDQQSEPLDEPNSNEEDPPRDAWNAFCTVGLRVYSKVPEMQLDVVEPVEEEQAILDRDAIAKSAASGVEADSKQKRTERRKTHTG